MKTPALILLAASLALPLAGQTTGPASTTHPTGDSTHRNVRAVSRPSASMRPAGHARRSTAQGAAARGDKPPIPELPAFAIKTREGLSVNAQALTRKGHWLLLYRRDQCIPCDRLMNVLSAGASAEPGSGQSYAIIVAGKQHDGLDTVRAAYANFANATWVGDTDGKVQAALEAHGSPMLYGMDGSHIVWRAPGNLGDPSFVDHMAAAWVATNVAAPSATTPASTPSTNGTTPTSAGK